MKSELKKKKDEVGEGDSSRGESGRGREEIEKSKKGGRKNVEKGRKDRIHVVKEGRYGTEEGKQ